MGHSELFYCWLIFYECPELRNVAQSGFVNYYLWMQAEDIIFLVFGNLGISFSVWLIGDSYVSLKNNSHDLSQLW